MKLFFFTFILLLSQVKLFPQHLEILPEKIYFEKFFADALSHQFSIIDDLGSREWFGNIGAVIPVADIEYKQHALLISTAATVYNTIKKTPGHIQVFTVDYLVDFFFDYKFTDAAAARFVFGHLSAHYSDDGIVELNKYPISYVRDYIGLQAQYRMMNSKIYAAWQYNFHIEPALLKENTFQAGADKFFNLMLMVDIYAAVDFKFKEEVDYIPTQSYQAGFKIYNNQRRALRIAYTFRSGYEERGQLYKNKDKRHTLGLYLDF